jgi:hypothetical protein
MKVLTYAVAVRHSHSGTDDGRWAKKPDVAFAAQSQKLEELVQKGFAKLDVLRSGDKDTGAAVNPDKPLYVFVAPEWLFKVTDHPLRFDASDFYTKQHREKYANLLTGLSVRGDAHVLLVAGTMLWIEERTTEAVKALREGTEAYEKRTQAKYEDAGKPRAENRLKQEEKVKETRQQVIQGTGKMNYLGYNEALVFFDGVQRKSVLKAWNANDFEICGGPDSVAKYVGMVHGLGAGVFHLPIGGGRLAVGVAICFDHSRVRKYDKVVDLYLLASCSQDLSGKKYVKDGGLIVHADCDCYTSINGGAQNGTVRVEKEGNFIASRALIDTDVA